MLKKRIPYRNKKILDSAKGEACTLQLPDICRNDTKTTVSAHSPYLEDGGGTATKSDDHLSAFACSKCHDCLDGRVASPHISRSEMRDYFHRAMKRTLTRLFEKGVLK